MVAHELPRKVALYTETAFVTGGPADWSANGTYFFVTAVDDSGVVQATVPNENNRIRPHYTHDHIRTRRVSSFSLETYLHANPTNAAEAAAATTFHLAELGLAALGGRDLGYAIGAASSEAEETDEVELDSDPGYAQGDWIYLKDANGTGQFYRVEAIAAGPPVTVTLDRDRHFTVDTGGADTVRAVIDCYIHQYAATQHDHASHKTMQFIVQGDLSEDVKVHKGCKPTLNVEPITPGQPLKLSYEVNVTTFEGADEATADDFGNATPVGEAPLVPGIGTTHRVWLADVGSPLAEVTTRGAITPNLGIAYTPVEGLGSGAPEGVAGYVLDITQDTTVELMVNWDADYVSEFRSGQRKHMLIQVGTGDDAVGLYFPALEYAAEPTRNGEGSLTSAALSFRAHENAASPGSLTGDNLEKWRSRVHLLFTA